MTGTYERLVRLAESGDEQACEALRIEASRRDDDYGRALTSLFAPRRRYDVTWDRRPDMWLRTLARIGRGEPRESVDARWLDGLDEGAPLCAQVLGRTRAHYRERDAMTWAGWHWVSVCWPRWDPSRDPGFRALQGARSHVWMLGGSDWYDVFLVWGREDARLIGFESRGDGAFDKGPFERGLFDVFNDPQSGELREKAQVDLERQALEYERALQGMTCVAERVDAKLEALDLDAPGAESRLDALEALQNRAVERRVWIERALRGVRGAVDELARMERDAQNEGL